MKLVVSIDEQGGCPSGNYAIYKSKKDFVENTLWENEITLSLEKINI